MGYFKRAEFWHRTGPASQVTFSLPCLGMTRAFRVRQTYDHRLRDAIAATGNADLFRKAVLLRCRLTRLVDLQLPRVPCGRCRDHYRAKLALS